MAEELKSKFYDPFWTTLSFYNLLESQTYVAQVGKNVLIAKTVKRFFNYFLVFIKKNFFEPQITPQFP